MYIEREDLKREFSSGLFSIITEVADQMGLECYAIGGYV